MEIKDVEKRRHCKEIFQLFVSNQMSWVTGTRLLSWSRDNRQWLYNTAVNCRRFLSSAQEKLCNFASTH